jgi:BMFP domain-containing protein YqiC
MIKPSTFKHLTEQWVESLPLNNFSKELKLVVSAHLQQQLRNANLVTRDEFDAQSEVLARTSLRLNELEKALGIIQTLKK